MPLIPEPPRRRRNLLIISALLMLVAVASVVNFEMRVPRLPLASNIVVFALFNLNLLVFLLLLVLLLRNLIKLWFERRQQLIGARFKSKLVLAFLSLSLAPAILIFVIASNFINRSIEGWFKPQVERPLDQALAVAQTYYQNLQATALRHAQHIARVIDRDGLMDETQREALAAYLVEQQEQLGLSTLTVFGPAGRELAHVKDPSLHGLPTRDINDGQLRLGLSGQAVTTVRELPSGDLIEAMAPVIDAQAGGRHAAGVVVVGTHVTVRLETKIRGIEQAFQEY
jgi:two-component system nitrogen regulation sensor histidine kinase NtrY